MEYHLRAAEQRKNLLVPADIDVVEFNRVAHLVEVGCVTRQQVVDDDDLARSLAEQTADDSGADESRSSGDNVVAHDDSWAIWDSRCRSDSLARRSAPGVKSKASSEIQPS